MRFTESELNNMPEERRAYVIQTMEEYGNNKWWESDDPEHVAMYQLFEPVLMVNFLTFHQGVQKMLGRLVGADEFGSNGDELRSEMRIATHRRERERSEIREVIA